MIIVRYADDIVVGFEHEADARRFWDAMRERLGGVLAVAASGQDPPDRVWPLRGGSTRQARTWQTGDLQIPGLHVHLRTITHGRFALKRKSRRDRMRAKLKEIKEELRRRMHQPIPEQGKWLRQVVTGFFAYHAVPTNSRALRAFRHHVTDLWRRSLRRRSQKDRMTWERIKKLADDLLPKPASFIPGRMRALPSNTQGGSRVPELGTLGSVRGALSNERPYRDQIGRAGGPEFG